MFAAVDLLVSLLTFSPKLRMTAEEALYQPYFREYSNGRDEPVALHPLYIEHEVGFYHINCCDWDLDLQNINRIMICVG